MGEANVFLARRRTEFALGPEVTLVFRWATPAEFQEATHLREECRAENSLNEERMGRLSAQLDALLIDVRMTDAAGAEIAKPEDWQKQLAESGLITQEEALAAWTDAYFRARGLLPRDGEKGSGGSEA